jgi:hypothetical protein
MQAFHMNLTHKILFDRYQNFNMVIQIVLEISLSHLEMNPLHTEMIRLHLDKIIMINHKIQMVILINILFHNLATNVVLIKVCHFKIKIKNRKNLHYLINLTKMNKLFMKDIKRYHLTVVKKVKEMGS